MEFALTAPVLFLFVGGTVEFGWFFMQQSQVLQAINAGARAGSYGTQADGETGCTACTTTAEDVALEVLTDNGFNVSSADLTITVEPIAGTCGIVIVPNIEPNPLTGLDFLPNSYGVRSVAYAQDVEDC